MIYIFYTIIFEKKIERVVKYLFFGLISIKKYKHFNLCKNHFRLPRGCACTDHTVVTRPWSADATQITQTASRAEPLSRKISTYHRSFIGYDDDNDDITGIILWTKNFAFAFNLGFISFDDKNPTPKPKMQTCVP